MIETKQQMKHALKSFRPDLVFYLSNSVSWLLLFFLPIEHALMFVVLVFALSGWALGTWPQPIISLGILLYLELVGISDFAQGLEGYAQPFVWLLVSTFIIASAFESTGLGRRIALSIFSIVKGNATASIGLVILALTILSFLIPTGAGRIAMILPVCVGLIEVVRKNGDNPAYAKSVLLGVTFTSSFMSFALITGSSSSVYAASTIQLMTGFDWNYLYWFIVNVPLALTMLLVLWLVLMWRYPIKLDHWSKGRAYIKEKLGEMGSVTINEKKLLTISLFMLAGWMTEPFHGYSVAMVAMFSAVLSCLPLFGVQQWKQASSAINWNIIILFGAAYALADAMQTNGTADWIAQGLVAYIPPQSPLLAAIVMLVLVTVFRLGFANMLGVTAVFLPLTISLAEALAINPVWLAQIVIITCSFGYFLPTQSPANLMTFALNRYSKADLFQVGIVLFIVTVPIMFLFAFFYWPLIGLSPYR
ncbi:SLC13 family permease [Halalkalibacter oceani]|uniref:SLC13 family permease n=1 Tax=Halalkalibacter oceani TaxID=1653776 RepID=UPI003394FD0B